MIFLSDRRSKNYGFVENSDGLLHLCILDNSFYFDREYSVHISSKLGETQKNKNSNLLNEAILRVTAINSKRLPNPNRIRRLYETNYQMIGKRIEEYLSTGRKI